jgi:hypothetical protein
MVLPLLALVLALPQLVGYLLTRWSDRAGVAEWLAAAVAVYSALWYVVVGARACAGAAPASGMASFVVAGTLGGGLLYQLVIGAVLATAVVRHKQRPARGR